MEKLAKLYNKIMATGNTPKASRSPYSKKVTKDLLKGIQ